MKASASGKYLPTIQLQDDIIE